MAFPGKPTIDVDTILAGSVAQLGIIKWVANYGYTPANVNDLGALKDIEISHKYDLTTFGADNVLAPVAVVRSDEDFFIKAKLEQTMDLKKLSMLSGSSDDGSDVTVVDKVAGTTDGTVTWGRGSKSGLYALTAHLHIEDLAITLSYGGNTGADIYTKADIIIPKCYASVSGSRAYKIKDMTLIDFELHAIYDSTVTTAGHELFKIVLTSPK